MKLNIPARRTVQWATIQIDKPTVKHKWDLLRTLHWGLLPYSDFLTIWPSWSWSYGSWIYNYLRNQCLSPLVLWVRISIRARCTTLCDKAGQCLVTSRWFSPGPPVSSINKTDRYNIAESGVKHHLTNKQPNKHILICLLLLQFHQTICVRVT
jgi:hypothetical protein